MRTAGTRDPRVSHHELVERLVRHRYALLAGLALIFWLYRLQDGSTAGGDWSKFVHAAYHVGSVQAVGVYVGPISLLAAATLAWAGVTASWIVWSAICMALGVYSIRCVEQAAAIALLGRARERQRAALVGGAFLLYVWSWPAVVNGHLDDVFALTAIAVALRGVAAGRWVVVSAAFAFAFASKPWAVLVLPLAGALRGVRIRGLALAVGLAVLPAVPFVIAHHGHLGAEHLDLYTYPDSTLRYLGVSSGARPSWARALQVAVALPLGAWAIRRGRWFLVPLLAIAVRVNLDPQTSTYYLTGVFLGLLVWDLSTTRLAGLRTALPCLALLIAPSDLQVAGFGGPWLVDAVVLMRLGLLVLALVALFQGGSGRAGPVEPLAAG